MPNTREDLYQKVTDQIIAALETEGAENWERPWLPVLNFRPFNPATKHVYRGINAFLLSLNPLALETGDPRWVTFKAAKSKGWSVRKGEKASAEIYFYKQIQITEKDDEGNEVKKPIPILKSWKVFHASQVDGIPEYDTKTDADFDSHTEVETLVQNSGATIHHGGDSAYYDLYRDKIQLPPIGAFESAGAYDATRLHELSHWTNHSDRVPRRKGVGGGPFGSESYAREELRAELSSALVLAALGISERPDPNHPRYLNSWISALKKDKKEIFRAASDAQAIADFLLGFSEQIEVPEYEKVA